MAEKLYMLNSILNQLEERKIIKKDLLDAANKRIDIELPSLADISVSNFINKNIDKFKGNDGSDGIRGRRGYEGPKGLPGVSVKEAKLNLVDGATKLELTFSDGTISDLGNIKGDDGRRGQRGKLGPKGESGDPGTTGDDGKGIKWRGEWINGIPYNENDLVTLSGILYIARRDTSEKPGSSEAWDIMLDLNSVPRGVAGGVTPSGLGEWATGQIYLHGSSIVDHATHNIWVATTDHTSGNFQDDINLGRWKGAQPPGQEWAIADNSTDRLLNIATLDGTLTLSAEITVMARRRNDLEPDRVSRTVLSLWFDGTSWNLYTTTKSTMSGAPDGVSFSVVTNGTVAEISYTSDLMDGVYDAGYSRLTYWMIEA